PWQVLSLPSLRSGETYTKGLVSSSGSAAAGTPCARARPGASSQAAAPAAAARKPRRSSSDAGAIALLADVDAALLGVGVLPPPATRAHVLAGLDRPRAGLAADRRIARPVQAVHRHVVVPNVRPHLLVRPVGERIHLHDAAVCRVHLDLGHVPARHALLAAQARHPGPDAGLGEVALHRLDLAQAAAELAFLDALVEEVLAVPAHHLLDRARVGEDHLDLDPVAVAHAVDEVVGRLRQPARVEHEDARGRLDAVHQVED